MSMNKVHSSGSLRGQDGPPMADDVIKMAYLKKMKIANVSVTDWRAVARRLTMKKKYFVLRREMGPDSPARLEYFDSQKKFRAGAAPKKKIILRNLFSINQKEKDPEHAFVIVLSSTAAHDNMSLVLKSKEELNEWLVLLQNHKQQANGGNDSHSQTTYQHVWMVNVQPRGLGSSRQLTGDHHICLTYRSLSLVGMGDAARQIDFPLNYIRKCGHTSRFFFLELGRGAVTGPGELWMLTEDAVIAENMHHIILNNMQPPGDSTVPTQRERTQSMSTHNSNEIGVPCQQRDRCGSMPTSRSRTTSEGSRLIHASGHESSHCHESSLGHASSVNRPPSVYTSSLSASCSPPFATSSLFSKGSSESMQSRASVDDFEDRDSTDRIDHCHFDEFSGSNENYTKMDAPFARPGSGHRDPPSSFLLPIVSSPPSSILSNFNRGLISPGSGSSTDGRTLHSPHQDYLDMRSPGDQEDRSYLCMRPGDGPPSFLSNLSMNYTGYNSEDTGSYLSMVPSPPSALTPMSAHLATSHGHSLPSSTSHSASHSRTSSLIEDMADGYLPMIPGCPMDSRTRSDGYLDMTPTPGAPTPIPNSPSDADSYPEMSPGSSCSFTSGTPSSDHRFHDIMSEKGCGHFAYSEDDDSSLDRPVRTSSVGSKPDQFRSRKNSAPMLGTSPVSNSWSGTPGTFFRGFLQSRNQERKNDLMEIDFSKNKSCDSITAEKEKKTSSIASIKKTFTGHRQRSNSKSGVTKSSMFDSIKRDKKKSESEYGKGFDTLPLGITGDDSYFEMDFQPSPRRSTGEESDGYLLMKPSGSSSISSTGSDFMDSNRELDIRQRLDSESRFSRQTSSSGGSDLYMDMTKGNDRVLSSSSFNSTGSRDGYVDMSQGKPNNAIGTASSSNTSISAGARVRKTSSTFNPLSSQDISNSEEYMVVDLSVDPSAMDIDSSKKREKNKSKRKSTRESTKRKRSEPIAVTGRGIEGEGELAKSKGTSPLSSLSNFLTRKNSSGTPPKTPLSPNGSPLPKSSRGTPSPFSSLTRSKSRESKDIKEVVGKELGTGSSSIGSSILVSSCIEEASKEQEESAISSDRRFSTSSVLATTVHTIVPSSCIDQLAGSGSSYTRVNKRTSGSFEPTQSTQSDIKLASDVKQQKLSEEAIGFGGIEPVGVDEPCSYVNLVPGGEGEEKQRRVSTGSLPADSLALFSSYKSTSEQHEYVNMCPGERTEQPLSGGTYTSLLGSNFPSSSTTSCTLPSTSTSDIKIDSYIGREQNRRNSALVSSSSPGKKDDQRRNSGLSAHSLQGFEGDEESSYLRMTCGQSPTTKPVSPRPVMRRPDIPPSLLVGRPEPNLTATLERLNLGSSGAQGERCRSHSGPGAPEATGGEDGRIKKQLSDPRGTSSSIANMGRAVSACSSPVSYSPPTSPTLGGSVSSMSSLSEGGMSSASSTCTVVNLGRTGSITSRTQELCEDVASVTSNTADPSATSHRSPKESTASSISQATLDTSLNYVALDLGPTRCESVKPSPRTARKGVPVPVLPEPPLEDEPLSYAQIDFTKSEGLRTTSLTHNHRP